MKTSRHATIRDRARVEVTRSLDGVVYGSAAPSKHAVPASSPTDHALGRYVWYVILLLAVVNAVNYMDRMALAVLLPYVKSDLRLADSQLGLLTGLAFSLFYAVCGIPIAWWADRGVRRSIISLALAMWSVMTALCGAAQSFFQLFGARVGVGAGEAGCIAPAQSILCDYVPFRRRAGVFAIQAVGSICGMMFGMALAGWLGATLGWRWTLVALGLPGVGLAVIVRLSLREPVRGALDQVKITVEPHVRQVFTTLWRLRTFRLVTLYYAVNGFVQYGLNQWWPSFYERQFGLSMASVGVQLGIAIGVGAGAGLLLGGALANRVARTNAKLPLLVSAIALLLAVPAVILSLFVSSMQLSMLFVAVTTLLWSIPNGTVTAAAMSVVPPGVRATAAAVNIFFAAVFGFALGPFVVGVFSDILQHALGIQALRYALVIPACFLPVMALLAHAAATALPIDLRAVGTPFSDDHQRPGLKYS